MSELSKVDELMHEDDVLLKWPGRFACDELAIARKKQEIGWFLLRKGPHYTEPQIVAYLNSKLKAPCQKYQPKPIDLERPIQLKSDLKSRVNGWEGKRGKAPITDTGMTKSPVASAEKALAQLL